MLQFVVNCPHFTPKISDCVMLYLPGAIRISISIRCTVVVSITVPSWWSGQLMQSITLVWIMLSTHICLSCCSPDVLPDMGQIHFSLFQSCTSSHMWAHILIYDTSHHGSCNSSCGYPWWFSHQISLLTVWISASLVAAPSVHLLWFSTDGVAGKPHKTIDADFFCFLYSTTLM